MVGERIGAIVVDEVGPRLVVVPIEEVGADDRLVGSVALHFLQLLRRHRTVRTGWLGHREVSRTLFRLSHSRQKQHEKQTETAVHRDNSFGRWYGVCPESFGEWAPHYTSPHAGFGSFRLAFTPIIGLVAILVSLVSIDLSHVVFLSVPVAQLSHHLVDSGWTESKDSDSALTE